MENWSLQRRWIMFLLGCIGLRLIFVLLARFGSKQILKIMGLLGLIPTIGFTYLWVSNSRLTGMETGGNKIWWHNFRIVHALLYGTFSYLALTNSDKAYIPLAFDVVIGLILFFLHHIFGFFKI